LQDNNYNKLLEQLVAKSVELNNLVAKYQQAVNKQSEHIRLHDKLLEQHCYKSAAGLLQLAWFKSVSEEKKSMLENG
jgi:hypothetical protein